jgi:CO/xanthine dehydrogenase Mo-binding subunit
MDGTPPPGREARQQGPALAQGDFRPGRQHRRPHRGALEIVADGAGVSFATHICDVEVDPETGRTSIVRYTVIQDAGKAVHPSYVEGQYQGGAAQGIGWALNEEYIYGKDGRLQNAGFLDYRIPVCSDLPMIDTQILEIPNPNHPYGVRGVGETSIVPPLGAIANAISNAFGVRLNHIPMSPPRVKAQGREEDVRQIMRRKHGFPARLPRFPSFRACSRMVQPNRLPLAMPRRSHSECWQSGSNMGRQGPCLSE